MSCPPGMILNPRSLRCVKATGRVAKDLVRHGNIGELDVGYYAAAATAPRARRVTLRAPRAPSAEPNYRSLAGAFGVGAAGRTAAIPALGALFAAPAAAAPKPAAPRRAAAIPELTGAEPCPPGTMRNPRTRRCIKITGRTYKRLAAPAVATPAVATAAPAVATAAPAVAAPAPIGVPLRSPAPRPVYRVATRAATAGAVRTSSESSTRLPVGSAAPAPIGDRNTILEWATTNCDNARDPLTNTIFAASGLETLQRMVRTHDGVCTLGPALHSHVAAAHRTGQIATLPADPSSHMTLDDFKALRNIMRREDPGYKIPGRRRQPPPPTWQLYIASDTRSGPGYATVMYVDTNKGRVTPYGVEYPPESVRVDLGFIPVSVSGPALCSPKTVSELIAHLADNNKLLVPVAGGWKAVGGFPYKKSYWDIDSAARLSRLCQDLAKIVASPI